MNNSVLGQILSGVFGNAMRGRQSGGAGGAGNGGLGDILGGALGRSGNGGGGGLGDILGGALGRGQAPAGRGSPLGGHAGTLIAMLLPLAMQWVQRNGGIGEVLKRVQQKGYGPQAATWMSTGPNEPLDPHAIEDLVGTEELSRMSQQLGLPREEVASGFAEIFPEMVDQLTPQGELPPDADGVLDDGLAQLQELMRGITLR